MVKNTAFVIFLSDITYVSGWLGIGACPAEADVTFAALVQVATMGRLIE